MPVTPINSPAEFENATKSGAVVVDFFATWCGPCRSIKPFMEAKSEEYKTIKFYVMDVDEVPAVTEAEDVTSMPTLKFYKDGKLVDTVIGAVKEKIEAALKKIA